MAYDNTNTGIISKNDRKEKDTHPDIAGSINVEGIEYWLNGWHKVSQKDGKPFYSLSLKRKEAKQEQHEGRRDQQPLDDEIPF